MEQGKKIFFRCIACHFVDKDQNKIGPSLKNVIGRKIGILETYHYSSALSEAGKKGLSWTKENLKEFLENSKKFLPGNKMPPSHLSSKDIEDLIFYLENFQKKS